MYTSGTTSLPKGVMLSFRDFTAYVTANVEMADGTERGAFLVCAPFYHIAGTTAMMTNLWTGRKMVVMPQFDPRAWLELVAEENVTHAFVVPTMMKQVLDEPELRQDRLLVADESRLRRRGDADRDHPPRDRRLPANGRLRQRLRPDRDHFLADHPRPRRPSDQGTRRKSSSSSSGSTRSASRCPTSKSRCATTRAISSAPARSAKSSSARRGS